MEEDQRSPNHRYGEIPGEDSQPATPGQSRTPSFGGNATGSEASKEHRSRDRPRVRFTPGGEAWDGSTQKKSFGLRDHSAERGPSTVSPPRRPSPAHSRSTSGDANHQFPGKLDFDLPADFAEKLLGRARSSFSSDYFEDISEEVIDDEKNYQQQSAQRRAQRLARVVGTHSAPGSAKTSPTLDPLQGPHPGHPVRLDDIPLEDLGNKIYTGDGDSDEEDPKRTTKPSNSSEAHRLVRAFSKRLPENKNQALPRQRADHLKSGQVTPVEERDPENYVPPPEQYRGGVLSSLLKLYNLGDPHGHHTPRRSSAGLIENWSGTHTPGSPESSGHATPKQKAPKWYENKSANASAASVAGLIGASSTMLAAPAGGRGLPKLPKQKKRNPLQHSGGIGGVINRMSRPRLEDEIRVTVHISELLSRQRYLQKLCRALMSYGAPTHRLEEYMKMTARVLEIDGQFLYMPGCMIISFDDAETHTTEVHLVRVAQGVNLGKLADVHEIYKNVVHDVIGVDEATKDLDRIIGAKQKHHRWILVGVYGLASVTVGPFAFGARLIDLPVAFLLGSILGILQLIIAPKSDLYSNVFEISAAVITSFLARAFGSIRGGDLFCFAGLAQSSIALILPGWLVLSGSLELQSKNILAGSVRMFYSIIYSLFLGFGITVGTAIYGLIDPKASSETTCRNQLPAHYGFIFVPAFTMCLIIINQAKWKQAPVMLVIAFAGYIVNYFSSLKFPSNAQISSTLGALAVGVLGNMYSRLRHGLAAAAILPAIFVQVPSGLAASGSLVSGITSANQLNGNATVANTTVSSAAGANQQLNSIVFNVGYSMIQVAIGITVGLFLSALIVYPLGKRRSGLFSF